MVYIVINFEVCQDCSNNRQRKHKLSQKNKIITKMTGKKVKKCYIKRYMELITGENDCGRRLDRILRKALPDLPLALIHRLLRQGQVFVAGKAAKAQDRLENAVIISIPSLKNDQKSMKTSINSKKNKANKGIIEQKQVKSTKNLPSLEIIWEGSGLLAVNKPVGLTVHGPESLDTMVQSYLDGKLPSSLSFRPGPLHRLDKPSSGIVVFSTSLDGARQFTSLLREQKVRKTYLAIVEGTVEKEEFWEDELFRDKEKKKTFVKKRCQAPFEKGGQKGCHAPFSAPFLSAITKVTPLAVQGELSLIRAEIATGRTHQIRAQAAAHGFPLTGDLKYKEQRGINRERGKGVDVEFFLHAQRLEFLDILIEAPLPEKFRDKAECFFGAFQI